MGRTDFQAVLGSSILSKLSVCVSPSLPLPLYHSVPGSPCVSPKMKESKRENLDLESTFGTQQQRCAPQSRGNTARLLQEALVLISGK
jgi:hypothetical protein